MCVLNFFSTARRAAQLMALFAVGTISAVGGLSTGRWEMPIYQREELRNEILEAFRHAYGSYMTHAYPADELMPLSCQGRSWKQRTRGTIDDALGGYALTMIDSLDMHAVVGDGEGFREATSILLEDFRSGVITFDRDVVVSVFEASIRVLGGLLSAHQIATELGPSGRLGPPEWYGGELLSLAHDLGKRLLPAFDTPLGIPVHRVNLRKGIPKGETRSTCSAAAGTFLIEFGALSRLTGDPSFEAAARRAVGALWERRSPLGLVGGGLDGSTGGWQSRIANIGAGTDSFYEYLEKSARLFRDERMGDMFQEAYAGVEEHLRWDRWHVEVDMWKGKERSPSNYRISSLQAFWPAVQASTGNVRAAERTFDALFGLWEEYEALPDFYDVLNNRLLHYGRDSPLRPEMAESSLALYRATGSTKYLRVGRDLFRALQANSRVTCGFASVADVSTGDKDDRMDSFFIAETLKYLFLLFDGSLPSERRKSIFCTPDQEDEVMQHHARRRAAAVSKNNTTSPGAAMNASEASRSGFTPGFSATTDGGYSTSVPVDLSGNTLSGDNRDRLRKRDGGWNKNDHYDGSGGGGEKNGLPLSLKDAPQCLLWADTVLSTEGHPFLVTALAATTTAAAAAGGGGGLSSGERNRLSAGESSRDVCSQSSVSSSSSPSGTDRCIDARVPVADESLRPTGSVSAVTPRAGTVRLMPPRKGNLFGSLDGLMNVLGLVRQLRAREGPDMAAEAAAGPTPMNAEANDRGCLGGDGPEFSSSARLSSFDPRHHYSPAVRSERFVTRPKNAELDVKCHHSNSGDPVCQVYAAGPELRSHMTRAVGEHQWSEAVVSVVNWVRDTVFPQEETLLQHQSVRYRLHQTSREALAADPP